MKIDSGTTQAPPQVAIRGALDRLALDLLKMFGIAALSGLFFSLAVGLVVLLMASNAYAQPCPPQKGGSETALSNPRNL